MVAVMQIEKEEERLIKRLSSSSMTEEFLGVCLLEYREPISTTSTTMKSPHTDCQSLNPSENYLSINMSVNVGQVYSIPCEQELK